MRIPWLAVYVMSIVTTAFFSLPLAATSLASPTSMDNEWKSTPILGRFEYSDPPKPDQVFTVYYRVVNGTLEKVSYSKTKVSTNGNGTLEIMFPRNYPYTNEEGVTEPNAESPILFSDGKPYDEPVTLKDTTECFFVFSIPFTGNHSIGLAWAYLLTNFAYHGDAIPSTCTPQTIVENVPTKKDGTITPLQQFKVGVAAEDTVCPSGELGQELHILLISPKGKPYCVKLTHEGYMKRHGWREPDTSTTPNPLPSNVLITLERTVCFGFCPSYSVAIYGNGSVQYQGHYYVAIKGNQTATIPQEDVQRLWQRANEIRYFDLKDEYFEPITDVPTYITSITVNGTTKRIVNYAGAPDGLRQFEDMIDDVAGSNRWVKCPDGGLITEPDGRCT